MAWRLYRRFKNKSSIGFILFTLFATAIVFNILLTVVLQSKKYYQTVTALDSDKKTLHGLKRSFQNSLSFSESMKDYLSIKHSFHKGGFMSGNTTLNVEKEFLDLFQNPPERNISKNRQENVAMQQSKDIFPDTVINSNVEIKQGDIRRNDLIQEVTHIQSAGNVTVYRLSLSNQTKRLNVTLVQYRSGLPTGNPLIDDYGKNNLNERGEMGKPVVLSSEEMIQAERAMLEFNVNTVASDVTPLNRLVPDSRINKCNEMQYDTQHLPTASIIIPFYDEWPSLLLRTIYSVINRSPRHLVKEIILIDDASTLEQLKEPLDKYIEDNFPQGLIRIVRVPERSGLIKARMLGCHEATGDVLIYFDSHMEVNIDWLPPLLTEIAKDKTVVAMATLDYVQRDSMEYKYNHNYLTRYGWNWRMIFFETFFREDQIGPDPRNPREGATMVGAAFAIDKNYFLHLGGYDESMTVWGGENLEMGWRVWLCGGRLLHVPCSRIGHVPRGQPYSFPGGREKVEHFNYKRAISVWMGNYTRFVYNIFPDMKTLDVGDISSRLEIKSRLGCKDFKWYMDKVWPELAIFDEDVKHWGRVKNSKDELCLDNNDHLFQYEADFHYKPCDRELDKQAFALTNNNLLKTSLQCVVCHQPFTNPEVKLEDCIIGTRDEWSYTKDKKLVHSNSKLCLDVGPKGPILQNCTEKESQIWTFHPFKL